MECVPCFEPDDDLWCDAARGLETMAFPGVFWNRWFTDAINVPVMYPVDAACLSYYLVSDSQSPGFLLRCNRVPLSNLS